MIAFKLENLRSLPAAAAPLRTDRAKTLILVKASGEVLFAKTVGDKDMLLRRFAPDADLLMLAWTGAYSTDIFAVTPSDLERYYAKGAA